MDLGEIDFRIDFLNSISEKKDSLKLLNSKIVLSNAHVTYKVNCMSHKQLPQNEPNHHKKCQKWPIYLSHKMMTLVLSQLIPSINTLVSMYLQFAQ